MKKPENVRIVYFLRGLGVGIIVTILLVTIHSAVQPSSSTEVPMTKEEIINKAKEYGLEEPLDNKLNQILDSENPSDDPNNPDKSSLPSTTPTPSSATD